jgi:hypothetical protein
MQYSVRNRRKLRQTGDIGIPRTVTVRGTGVAEPATPAVPAPAEVIAEGSGQLRTIESPVKEITPAQVIKNNWQR